MQHLAMATDFSSTAENAFLYAAHLAAHFDARLTVLHVQSPSPLLAHSPGDLIDASITSMRKEAKQRMAKYYSLLEEKTDIADTLDISMIVLEGLVVDALAAWAGEHRPDALVVGTHGASGWREMLFSTHTAKMIAHVPVPLLAIPPKFVFRPIRHLAFAVDYHEMEPGELADFRQWLQLWDARGTLIHVHPEEDAPDAAAVAHLKQAVNAFAGMPEVQFKFLAHDEPLIALNEWAGENQVDVLAVKHHKRGFFQQLLHKSLSKKISQYTLQPLLVFSSR